MSKTFKIKIEGKEYDIPCDPPANVGFPIVYAFSKFKEDNAAELFKNPNKLIEIVFLLVKSIDPSIKSINPTTIELMEAINKIGLNITFKKGKKGKK